MVREIIAFDLSTIVAKHPEHKDAVDWLVHGAQPAYMYGMLCTADLLKMHAERSQSRRPEEIGGLWAFTGETNRQRDVRLAEDQKTEMLVHAEAYSGGLSNDLLKLLYELKPAYYRVIYGDDNKPVSYLRRSQFIKDKTPPSCSFEQLIAGRDTLQTSLEATYADTATIATKSNPKQPRFSVCLRKNGLTVMVLLTDAEDNRYAGRDKQHVAGVAYADYIAQIAPVWENCPVTISQWTLDRSATED
jgi:hypothetical protein